MSKNLTLQADLTLPKNKALNFRMLIPSGTIVTFLDASDFAGVAEELWEISPGSMTDNLGGLNETITASNLPGIANGDQVFVTYGANGARRYLPYQVSASPSRSPSLSPSASVSLSPSSSASLSPSSSASRSPSASPSRSPSAS